MNLISFPLNERKGTEFPVLWSVLICISDIHGLGGLGEIANGLTAATSGAFMC